MRKFLIAQQVVRDLKRHFIMSLMALAAICIVLVVRHGRMIDYIMFAGIWLLQLSVVGVLSAVANRR